MNNQAALYSTRNNHRLARRMLELGTLEQA